MKTNENYASKLMLAAIILVASVQVKAQVKLGDNKQTVNAGALLELESSAAPYKGLLLTRVPLTSTGVWGLAGNATAGMLVYNTNTAITSADTVNYPLLKGGAGTYIFDGTGWKALTTVFHAQSSGISNNILSFGRVPYKASAGLKIVVADAAVTSDCIILVSFESDFYSPFYKINGRTPGVSFSVDIAQTYSVPPDGDPRMYYLNYVIVKNI